jgi:hypothetical protein
MREQRGQDAASVAAQLQDFLRDPARARLRFARGVPMPAGHHLLRFAQGKFPEQLAGAAPSTELERLRGAADRFIREVCFRTGATHYEVLCAPRDASRDAIKESYHLLMALIHPDRRDATRDRWPTDCAQRVNRAYAVLADEPTRRAYDESLGRAHEAGAPRTAPGAARTPRERRHGSRRAHFALRLAKVLLVVTAVVGTLLLLEAWVSDVSGASSVLQGALQGARARDTAAKSDLPRFIGSSPVTSRAMDELPPPAPPARFSALLPWWPQPASPPPVERVEAPPLQSSPAPQIAAMAQVPVATPPQHVSALAQVSVAPPPEAGLGAREIETLVARLVSYYEAGEADKLMGLLDARESGYWKTLRTRQAYADFFSATRERRLRVDDLAWQTTPGAAHAKGIATVVAEYFDPPGLRERRVEVEMDIALRDGRAVITQLTLYPNAP